ncbi:uncharacterized protein RCO7_00647 [Rhynchosporium graminicola]|uniref:EthD domain-containing protein n=1 Tax=Rhynchosporium graminicola TaxID=2792576 RepID=A0A1E1LSF2_9HELO|nr:uncharacterized protein RCO7_00647 [Rhynchosporium commune]
MSAPAGKTVHLTILMNKLETLTHQAFHTYWTHEHPKVWFEMAIVKKHVLKYTQFHVDEKVSEGLRAAGLPIAEYDGGVQIWGRSVEDLMAVFQDPEYLAKVVPDEQKFLKRSEAKMMIGWDEVLWSCEERSNSA